MVLLGAQAQREVVRTRQRVLAAMRVQAAQQGRFLGGRPPYGYRLVDAGKHPNSRHSQCGRVYRPRGRRPARAMPGECGPGPRQAQIRGALGRGNCLRWEHHRDRHCPLTSRFVPVSSKSVQAQVSAIQVRPVAHRCSPAEHGNSRVVDTPGRTRGAGRPLHLRGRADQECPARPGVMPSDKLGCQRTTDRTRGGWVPGPGNGPCVWGCGGGRIDVLCARECRCPRGRRLSCTRRFVGMRAQGRLVVPRGGRKPCVAQRKEGTRH